MEASNSGVKLRLRAGRVSLQRNMPVEQKMLPADGAVIVAQLLQQSLQCAAGRKSKCAVYRHTTAPVYKA